MSKCIKCGNLFINNPSDDEMCHICKIADLEAKLAESQKPKEIRFNGFVADCNYDEARKVLQEDILKMQAENKKLKESVELSNYAKVVLENKKLEEDLELSEKCCVEYEQEITELKQQLAEKEERVKQLKLDLGMFKSVNEFINGYGIEKAREVLLQTEKTKIQDKISFAVEKLKETKIYVDNQHFMNARYKCEKKVYADIWNFVDNQIEELKKEMK